MKNFSIKTSFEQIRDFRSLQDKIIQPSQAVTNQGPGYQPSYAISIHTALAGCDGVEDLSTMGVQISIHTALAGCDY